MPGKDITVSELVAEKERAEKKLREFAAMIVANFQENTGATVTGLSVDLYLEKTMGNPKPRGIVVAASLDFGI